MPFLSKQIKTEPKLGALKGTGRFRLVSSLTQQERDILKEIRAFYKQKQELPASDLKFLQGILLRRTTGSNLDIKGLSPRQLLNEVSKLSIRKGVKDLA